MARFAAGVKVAVVPAQVTAPGTAVDPCFKVNVVALIVEVVIATLKIAEMLLLTAVPVALFTGTVEVTVGGTPGGLSFLQPAKNTINSIAMIGNTFLRFILVYFKIEKKSQNKNKSVNSGKCYIFLEKSYIIHTYSCLLYTSPSPRD